MITLTDIKPLLSPSERANERSAASLARALRRRVPEATYLVTENADRYRPIMRLFYERHMAHHYTLQTNDVLEHTRLNVMREYTEAQCEQDLRQLCDWGNLAAEQDRSRAHTVEEFLRRKLLYNITPYGIAFERLLVELEDERGTQGSLDVGLLEALLESIEVLEPLIDQLPLEAAPSDEALIRQVQRAWSQAYDMFDRVGKQASDYLSALDRSRHDDIGDLESFLAYKDILIQYLNAFATSLYDYGDRVRSLLNPWPKHNKPARLVAALVEYELRFVPPPDGRVPDRRELQARHERTWWNLYHWFQSRGGLDTMRRRTTGAIERVVRQSQRLMDRRSGISRKRDFEQLATRFASCENLADCHRLAGLSLGCIAPRHLMGSAEIFLAPEKGSAWEMTPQDIYLRPIRRGQRRIGRPEPVVLFDTRQERVLREEMDRREAESALWDALFVEGYLNLGTAQISDPAVRAKVLALLAACLASPLGETLAPDGSSIRLDVPPSPRPGSLSSSDGTLHLPCFVLRREKNGRQTFAQAAGHQSMGAEV